MKGPDLAPESTTNAVDSGTQRLTIFVLDFVNSSLNEQRTARRDLLKFLSKSLDIKEPVSLLAVQQSGIKAIHDFTTDPAVLVAALERVIEGHLAQPMADSIKNSGVKFPGTMELAPRPANSRLRLWLETS
jgi:hypothetical protein